MKTRILFLAAIGLMLIPVLWAQNNNSNPQKYALVIGNGAYRSLTPLANPVNDAEDMAAALESLGFSVEVILNGSLEQMESASIRLQERLSETENSYGFFFLCWPRSSIQW